MVTDVKRPQFLRLGATPVYTKCEAPSAVLLEGFLCSR